MMESGDPISSGHPELPDTSVTEPSKNEFEDPSSAMISPEDVGMNQQNHKRSIGEDSKTENNPVSKKHKPEEDDVGEANGVGDTDPDGGSFKKEANCEDDAAPIPAATKGISEYGENDVLSGRGGGTNVHPGNRNFRDLINLHRRAYLKARKNDKPAISRAIVKAIRDTNGKFLKKDDKSGLWFEIGDDAAREKTSQALRQRAPEMRKLLFDAELEEARMAAGPAPPPPPPPPQQRMMMGMHGIPAAQMQMAPNPMLNQAFMNMSNKGPNPNGHHMMHQEMMYGQAMFPGMMYPNAATRYHQNDPPST